MDHRWDESTWQDRAARGERERFGTSPIARDPDVERRDQLRFAERLARVNQSPWAIGNAYYDQRDTYTRNAEVDASGYGRGPSIHPEEGSYAYQREPHQGIIAVNASHATLHEKEAWPWLIYKDPEDDPYFAHLHEHEHREPGLWDRLKERIASTLHLGHRQSAVAADEGTDARIAKDVDRALMSRGDLDATDIEISVKGGEVTLQGTVRDRRSKHIAEEVAEGVQGVRDVHNRLTIRHDDTNDANVAFVLPLALMGA